MDFRAEIEHAEQEVEEARAAHARATRRLEEAVRKLGALTGVYRGLSAFEQSKAEEPKVSTEQVTHVESQRKRAPKGEARRRVDGMLTTAWPDGLSRQEMLRRSAEEGKPIPEGTLRHALTQLEQSGRARPQDDLWFATAPERSADTETAGARESNPAASLTQAQEDNHEAALTELMR